MAAQPRQAADLTVGMARDGIVGRGVLLDTPRLRGVPWLEPGEFVTGDELAAAETAHHLRVGRGDPPTSSTPASSRASVR
ncbi:hypothetical protein [Streptomyces sp. NPDC057909]|uniref:hypothetical protein n=1 Tax=Streptomyces sp. NPDC057909 TaxID=3346277 RepID=UPI0036E7E984